jgi:hypothetical protein
MRSNLLLTSAHRIPSMFGGSRTTAWRDLDQVTRLARHIRPAARFLGVSRPRLPGTRQGGPAAQREVRGSLTSAQHRWVQAARPSLARGNDVRPTRSMATTVALLRGIPRAREPGSRWPASAHARAGVALIRCSGVGQTARGGSRGWTAKPTPAKIAPRRPARSAEPRLVAPGRIPRLSSHAKPTQNTTGSPRVQRRPDQAAITTNGRDSRTRATITPPLRAGGANRQHREHRRRSRKARQGKTRVALA